ncbi:MAG: hypothetical protein ACM3H8_07330 [Sphingobacteriales bacterium]
MKTSTMILSALVAGTTLFSSCTKSLKNDIKDLKQDVADIQGSLGSNEPITATTTFVDDSDVTRTVTGIYKFKSGNAATQSMTRNPDGTYAIYIERFSDVEWYEGAWASFTYNPTTKAVTNKIGGHYWDDQDPYYDRAKYDENFFNTGLTMDIKVNNIDVATGDISISFSASGTSAYTTGVSYTWSPNQGKAVSTNFTFTGKLTIFSRN